MNKCYIRFTHKTHGKLKISMNRIRRKIELYDGNVHWWEIFPYYKSIEWRSTRTKNSLYAVFYAIFVNNKGFDLSFIANKWRYFYLKNETMNRRAPLFFFEILQYWFSDFRKPVHWVSLFEFVCSMHLKL